METNRTAKSISSRGTTLGNYSYITCSHGCLHSPMPLGAATANFEHSDDYQVPAVDIFNHCRLDYDRERYNDAL